MAHRHPIFGLTVAALIGLFFGATPSAAQTDVIGQWSRVASLPYFPVHTHMLPTGKVMIWPGDGGVSGNDPRSWDPADPFNVDPLNAGNAAHVTSLTPPGYDLFCSGHSFLADGTLFVAGGHISNNVGLSRAAKYNPVTNAWSNLPDMNAGRWYPTTTVLANGDVLVVSGDRDLTIGVNTLPQVFQVATGTWRNLTSAQLGMDLYPPMLLAPNGRVFNAGPQVTTRYLDTSGPGAWSNVANRVGGGFRSYGSAVMYAPGKVLVMGGDNPPTNTAEVIDLNAPSPSWRAVDSMQFIRRQINATLLPDGNVLVTGGTSSPGFNNPAGAVDAAELWNPTTEQWTTLASSSGIPRVYHSAALLLPDGRVLSTGGNGVPQRDPEIYSPPYLFKGTRPTIASAPTSVAYGQSFFVGTPDAAAISKITMLRLSSVTHAFNMSQYISNPSFSQTTGGLNVTAPLAAIAIGPPPVVAPPGHYLLFILNGNGVPSDARIIQLGGTAGPDTTPPTVSITAPANGATVSGTGVTVSATASDNVGVVGVQFKLDGANLGAEDTTSPYSVTWNSTTAANGSHTLTALARDAVNTTLSAGISVTVDNAPPTVSITAPANGATVSGAAVAVSATASDNVGVVGVQFKLDGANLGAEDTTSPYSVTWNSTTAINGSHTLTALARDAVNTTLSAGVSVTVSNAASCPQTALNVSTASSDGGFAYFVAGSFGTPADNSSNPNRSTLRLFEGSLELGPAHSAHAAIRNPGQGRFSHWSSTTGAGEAVRFAASDNTDPRTNGRSYTYCVPGAAPDTTPPTVSITAPANGATVSGTVVTVSATASDNVGVVGVQFKLDGANLGAEDTTSPYSVTWNSTTAANGSHTLTALARDAVNTTLSAGVSVTVDNASPTVSLTAPANGATVSGTGVTVSATASDNVGVVGVQFKLDGANLGVEDTTAPYSVPWDSTTATDASHTLTAVARDAAGSTTTSAGVSVTVDNASPTVSITAPANGATVSGTGVTVSATASDNVGVVGVQFKLDGANLGAEDTTAPYSVPWDSTAATDASHTLAAVARDAAGNTTTSAGVSVIVDNAPNDPPTASSVLISGTAQVGQVLTGSFTYADAEGDLQGASTFRWVRNGTPIAEATAQAYPLVAADETTLVSFEVTPVAQSGTSPGLAVTSAAVGPVTPAPNDPPTASSVLISGTAQVGQVLTGSFTYADAEGDLQGASTFRWVRNGTPIAGATAQAYPLVAADETTLVSFEVTPVAQSGTSPGLAVTSPAVGPVTPAPNDPPTVSITAPANGATVSGSAVTVSAAASDNVGVVGVQFKLDGANLGAEDTTSPYSVTWNTTTAANGSHTLTALARDAVDTTLSAGVSVTVSNAASCPQTALNVSVATSDGGFAYFIGGSFGTPADNGNNLTQSSLRLFEGSLELGPAHSAHAAIRNPGQGRFSHWSSTSGTSEALRFAASDNTDPRTNGRSYTYCAATTSTGFLVPSANAAVTSGAGDNNGFQTTPSNAYVTDGSFAVDTDSGTNTNTSCTDAGKDKHSYYNYNFIVPSGVSVRGIEVRLNARADSATNSPRMCAQLSWNGGASWTTAVSTTTLSTATTTYILGGATNTWGRTWTVGDFSNADFRVRIIDVASSTARDFSLDGVAVQVTYQ